MPQLHALLLDFDGLLADYDHRIHLRLLADAAGSTPEQVDAALRADGLELAHARGELGEEQLLQALNQRLGSRIGASHWYAARHAATGLRSDCTAVLRDVRPGIQVAILTNNGLLTRPVITALLPDHEVLCSAALGMRKPDPAAYLAACSALRSEPRRTLFVDHLFRNVQGAREAGLHADTAFHAQSLRRLLKRHHCLR